MTDEFQGLSAPARRALANAGYRTLADPARTPAADLAKLHGMGPSAIKRLEAKLAAAGLAFSS